jgi:hypothetical protein
MEGMEAAILIFRTEHLQRGSLRRSGKSKEGQILKVYKKEDSEVPGKVYIHIKENDRCVFECCVKIKSAL